MTMNADLFTAFTVSVLALGVIFLVLGILIGVIKALVVLLPNKEEKAPSKISRAPAPNIEEEEHTVAIHAAIAVHLGKMPQQIQITNINSI